MGGDFDRIGIPEGCFSRRKTRSIPPQDRRRQPKNKKHRLDPKIQRHAVVPVHRHLTANRNLLNHKNGLQPLQITPLAHPLNAPKLHLHALGQRLLLIGVPRVLIRRRPLQMAQRLLNLAELHLKIHRAVRQRPCWRRAGPLHLRATSEGGPTDHM